MSVNLVYYSLYIVRFAINPILRDVSLMIRSVHVYVEAFMLLINLQFHTHHR
jgi:hypothetical protein